VIRSHDAIFFAKERDPGAQTCIMPGYKLFVGFIPSKWPWFTHYITHTGYKNYDE